MRPTISKRWLALAVAVGAMVFGLAAVAYAIARQAGMDRLAGQLRDRLTVTMRSVESEIERFGYLPEVLGEDERIVDLLTEPSAEAVALANDYLATIAAHSQADAAYIVDPQGLTLSASNWNLPSSFVGHNYGFRPYFLDAVRTGEGSYYAVGVTTGVPGYFLSARIGNMTEPLGVAVVKVDMAPLERAWSFAGEMTGLADDAGVVFLTGISEWKYRPLYTLADADREVIDSERRYAGIDVAARTPLITRNLETGTAVPIRIGTDELLMSSMRIEPQGWKLFSALPTAPVNEEARLIAGLAALLSLVCILVGLYMFQRRQLTRFKLEQNAILERRVAERTVELAREVEERKRAEAELRETQDSLIHAAKLAALGRMSAAIVHEVSQPLSALDSTLAAANLHMRNERKQNVETSIGTARELLKRMQRTVKHLKSFASRTQAMPVEPISLATSINAAIEIVASRAKELGVTVSVTSEGDVPSVAVNAVRIEQVLINLLLNAVDATASAGNTSVSIAARPQGDRALVEIVDAGPGMPDTVIEPFFTTKKTGEGLGLGVSISRAILEDYAGTLAYAPASGGGTVTTVSLPIASARPVLEAAS